MDCVQPSYLISDIADHEACTRREVEDGHRDKTQRIVTMISLHAHGGYSKTTTSRAAAREDLQQPREDMQIKFRFAEEISALKIRERDPVIFLDFCLCFSPI